MNQGRILHFPSAAGSDYKGRDGCRVPILGKEEENAGFSTLEPWLPMPRDWHQYSVDSQDEDPGSMLNYYRSRSA